MQLTNEYFSVKKNNKITSNFLNRKVVFDLILPNDTIFNGNYKTLYINDGQDFEALDLVETFTKYYSNTNVALLVVAVHTNEHRLQEYGTSYVADYKNRGNKATEYMNFVTKELMPNIQKNYYSSKLSVENFFCGFSLGGLSAFDIVWENPNCFSKVGVFSGSFWWRDKGYEQGFTEDTDRIAHKKVRNSYKKEGLKFWFECGTNDEAEDRNNNGIIDSIDDTNDLIAALIEQKYSKKDISYYEIKEGEHNYNTWKKAFPVFISWLMSV
jgi:predicted alpha/beta superfamily hydrolase